MYRRSSDPRNYLVAESPTMQAVVAALETHAACDAPVLICGERGTGRELVARVLHLASHRRQGRFVAVRPSFDNGEAGGDDDELRAKRALRAAQGGTLLIKDVCDVPAVGQRTLRRAMRLTDGARKPDTAGETFDVRVVGSAGLELERAVAAKILSRELYDSLALRRIDVPPLRHRASDIPTLVELGYPGLNLASLNYVDAKVKPYLPTQYIDQQFWIDDAWWAENGNKAQELWNAWMLKK